MTIVKTPAGEIKVGEGVKPIRRLDRGYKKQRTGPGSGRKRGQKP